MRRSPALAFALLLLVPVCLAACGTDSAQAHRRQRDLLEDAPASEDPRVVVIRIFDSSRLVASEMSLNDLRHAPGVMEATRGSGKMELYALVAGTTDPQTLVLSLENDGHRCQVVRVVTMADLDKE